MLIEIRKVGFENKGAHLMLLAVLAELKKRLSKIQICMSPSFDAPYENRARLGLLQKAYLWRYNFQFGHLAALFPKRLRSQYGIVLDKELDVVLDSAGFAYGSAWGDRPTVELATLCKFWRRNNTKIILLPQAFGPFSTVKIRGAIKEVVCNAELIFARDLASFNYLMDVVGSADNIRLAPDLTGPFLGFLPDDAKSFVGKYCVVPNVRMLDSVSCEIAENYIPFLVSAIKMLFSLGKTPFLLIHEGKEDELIAEKIRAEVQQIQVVKEANPLKIKGIIGVCEGFIGSRFHGIVSSLSQGVPAIATSWSHKYQTLLNDYGFPEGLIADLRDFDSLSKLIKKMTNDSERKQIVERIRYKSRSLNEKVENMWDAVFSSICKNK